MQKNTNSQEYVKILNKKKTDSQQLLNSMQEENQVESHELSSYDNHPGDLGTEMFDKEHNMGLEFGQEMTIKEIDLAIKKTEQGTYGICEFCKKPIHEERLKVLPEARYCIDCEKKKEADMIGLKGTSKATRPAEEDIIH